MTKEEIMNDVNIYTGYNISNPQRTPNLVRARQVYYVLCREFTVSTYAQLGKMAKSSGGFRYMNHGSILSSVNLFEIDRKRYKMHNDLYNKLRKYYLDFESPYFKFETFICESDLITTKTHTRKDLNTLMSLKPKK